MKMVFLLTGALFCTQAFASEDECTQLVESVRIPVNGKTVSSENTLETRMMYKIVARGTFDKEDIAHGDAKYAFNRKQDLSYTRCNNDPTGVLFGIAVANDGGAAIPEWGPFSLKHVYSIEMAGREHKLEFHYQDCRLQANKGSLMIDIYKCSRREKIR